MDPGALHDRWTRAGRTFGDERRTLSMGPFSIELRGLDRELSDVLARRWGGFLGPVRSEAPTRVAELRRAGPGGWLDPPAADELYRIEAVGKSGAGLVCSYHFAVAREPGGDGWRVALSERPDEPVGRVMDNAGRWLAAGLAVDARGFAMHAAGVLRDGRAWLFAGPSGSGKSTAVALAGEPTLGDDFAFVVRGPDGWHAPATPFDNTERIEHRPPRGLYPVAGIWRLLQADVTRVERSRPPLDSASLMGCVAFPWALPDRSQELVDHVERFVREGRFRQLYFARDADLWTHLL